MTEGVKTVSLESRTSEVLSDESVNRRERAIVTDIAGTTKGHAGGAYLSSGDQPQCGEHSGNPGHRGRGRRSAWTGP